ncbi:MAG: hypothetical protein V1779_17445 [bacterium]
MNGPGSSIRRFVESGFGSLSSQIDLLPSSNPLVKTMGLSCECNIADGRQENGET